MEGPSTLQDSFLRFKKKLVEDRIQKTKADVERTAEFKRDLREKFVAQAMSYIGVPYSRKKLPPDSPLRNSPLFLDCCGLVRRCVYDLRDLFGFRLGRWNQAYQFDTLPDTGMTLQDMLPGDLIFYSATYYSPTRRRQIHNMVHVEIFLGHPTPEATIASRSATGAVSTYDSYQFVSQNYYDVRHYFRSIDPWLNGICITCCSEHQWKRCMPPRTPSKYSVFYTPPPTLPEELEGDAASDDGDQERAAEGTVEAAVDRDETVGPQSGT
mmetsp:Transcript_23738/g.40885  ORF Transcript_23738/g.40885 Transcript_23738/m.40885 type:complete len:268 (+) Transcript_23738:101-904(+)|eukprot:CAMPEP_0196665050 /NCGR_PEP_ID=MMETSP1086-20130531/59451_1 /TAXON_ID=77921 /ORGANISM="Cyanoptyche  gloeocystis , Strain SAG4.97" /LENGTH=267 /DNA_ID=CAMNT_0042001621 /DNA_START=100 /DNA_END=903 /DNA_ORIENTATION=+